MCTRTRQALYSQFSVLAALDNAIHEESLAIAAWEQIVRAASDVYHDNMRFGRNMPPHWKNELAVLKDGLQKLQQQRKSFKPKTTDTGPSIAHVPVRKRAPHKELLVWATIGAGDDIKGAKIVYQIGRGDCRNVDMKRIGPFVYRAAVPGKDVKESLTYLIEATDGKGRQTKTDVVAVTVTDDNEPPTVKHEHITTAAIDKPLAVTTTVTDPSGVKWVRLRYRSVNQHQDYKSLDMVPTGNGDRFSVVVGAEDIASQWDFMYLIEVMDNHDNGRIYPDLEKETPYIVVRLQR